MREYYREIFCTAGDALDNPSLKNIIIRGFLVPNEDKNLYEIWFPYSIEIAKLIKPNKFLCARNFSNFIYKDGKILIGNFIEKFQEFFSVLEIVDVDIIHYDILAMSKDPSKLKLEETFEGYKNSWRRSSKDPEDDKLRIVVKASSCSTELVYRDPVSGQETPGGQFEFRKETEPPAYGEDVFIMRPELVDKFINGDFKSNPSTFVIGYHKMYGESLSIRINHEQLFNRHFGIFGFSGAGKSNLSSTIIRRSLNIEKTDANVVIFDSNSEYLALLLDIMLSLEGSCLILLDNPGGYIGKYLKGELREDEIPRAAKQLLDRTALPDEFMSQESKERLLTAFEYLFLLEKVKIYCNSPTVIYVIEELLLPEILKDLKTAQPSFKAKEIDIIQSLIIRQLLSTNLSKMSYNAFIHENLKEAIDKLKEKLAKEGLPEKIKQETIDKMVGYMDRVKFLLDKIAKENHLLEGYVFSINYLEITQSLHDEKKSLFILVGDDDNSLRDAAFEIGNNTYYLRKNGLVSEMPNVLFFFEEADLFLPSQSSGQKEKESVKRSKSIATTLARRGRKYRLGIGISTQRISYMDTSIIAQLSTYFVSKLPRKYDREKVAEAFGVETQSVDNTLSLETGEWMIITHSGALYRRGVPVIAKVANANKDMMANLEGVIKNIQSLKDIERLVRELIASFATKKTMVKSEEDLSPVVITEKDCNKSQRASNETYTHKKEKQEDENVFPRKNDEQIDEHATTSIPKTPRIEHSEDKFFNFFSSIVEKYASKDPSWNPIKPQKNQTWLGFGAGKAGVMYRWRIKEGRKICVELYINKENEHENLEIFEKLLNSKKAVELSFSGHVEWDSMPGKKACAVRVCKEMRCKFKELPETEYDELALWAGETMYLFKNQLSLFLKA